MGSPSGVRAEHAYIALALDDLADRPGFHAACGEQGHRAIGVSGGSSQQDAQVAQAGVAALEALLKAKK